MASGVRCICRAIRQQRGCRRRGKGHGRRGGETDRKSEKRAKSSPKMVASSQTKKAEPGRASTASESGRKKLRDNKTHGGEAVQPPSVISGNSKSRSSARTDRKEREGQQKRKPPAGKSERKEEPQGEKSTGKKQDGGEGRRKSRRQSKEQRRLLKKWGVEAEESSSEEEQIEDSDEEEESTDPDIKWLRAHYACSQQEATRALQAATKQGKTREAAGRAMQKHWNIPSIALPKGKRGKRIAQSSSKGRKEPEEGEKIAERKATRTAGRPAKEQKKHRDASKAMEFREHVTATKTKERRRDSTLGVMREALAQLDRRQRGKVLNREQRQLADLGETLSPARVYGYGAGNAGRASSTEEQSGSDGSGSGSDFSSDDEILRFSNGDSEALGGGGGGECGVPAQQTV